DADDVVEAVLDRREVGQDEVDPWLVLLGEEHAAVDDEDLAVVLEGGHVAADLTETTDRSHAERALGEGFGSGDGGGHGRLLCRTLRARSYVFSAWERSSSGAVHLRQGAAGGGVAVGTEVGEVGPGDTGDQRELVLDDRGLPFLRSDQWQAHTRAADTSEAVQD